MTKSERERLKIQLASKKVSDVFENGFTPDILAHLNSDLGVISSISTSDVDNNSSYFNGGCLNVASTNGVW